MATMPTPQAWRPEAAIPTLICSMMSSASTAVLLAFWVFAKGRRDSFRYALIMNLTLAEFINSTNNTISGLVVAARRRDLTPTAACRANGWLGQVSVQAADFAVFLIALATLVTLVKPEWVLSETRKNKLLMCGSGWLVPLITASVALGLNVIGPVSGNWCWIVNEPRKLRYALGHGWRLLIFAIVIGIYSALFVKICMRARRRRAINERNSAILGDGTQVVITAEPDNIDPPTYEMKNLSQVVLEREIRGGRPTDAYLRLDCSRDNSDMIRDIDKEDAISPIASPRSLQRTPTMRSPIDGEWNTLQHRNTLRPLTPFPPGSYKAASRGSMIFGLRPERTQSRTGGFSADQEMRQWFMLAIFPLTYIVIWIPGVANRLYELSGNTSPTWLVAIQATTQLSGLANALVYGLRERQGGLDRSASDRSRLSQKRNTVAGNPYLEMRATIRTSLD